ncbi:HAMP domain-containing sensor histidine kinase [Asticcacaulis sp. EMRT-3]|uniref:HAMP domain-containing sensor histidine kinase n=1 Tax=Asticcacaulis sp. EMRT-3 TaxID=3040349 RepID=UPI0024AEB8B1|nr:HAMP domain-containing sensor histidine kinase [Asticcacaulis sp. EMRT-3]MDI7776294.1 HAMP domain-containing sensor histidine kinase [Asticcacaulis sp. EMRT-3]
MPETTPASPAPVRRDTLNALPIFWQVLGLSLIVLALALIINTLLVLKAPAPPPSGYTLAEAAAALKTGQARLHNGHLLRAETRDVPPDYVVRDPGHQTGIWAFQALVSARLAEELAVPVDTIWVHFTPRRDFEHHRSADRLFGPDQGPPQQGPLNQAVPPVQNGPGHHPLPPFGLRPHDFGGPSITADTRANIIFPAFSAAWKLPNGRYRVITEPKTLIEPWQERLLFGFGLGALIILPLAYLLSQRLSRPIIAFSEAAAKLSVEDDAPPVLAVGPREVRQAALVLNAMQMRIRKQVESRTMLMGAIAHDLKTPLARMRLRIEDLPTPIRDKLSQDIAHMDGLIRSAMSFTSAHKLGESLRPLDLSSLVESLAEDLSAICEIETPLIEAHVTVRGDQIALSRILTNLIENAGRYAGGCRIALSTRGNMAELHILDEGPGLPPETLEAVFEPFYRLEASRNRDTGGTGLGLSVARALAEAQGGALTLHNRYAGSEIAGLEARLTLPLWREG